MTNAHVTETHPTQTNPTRSLRDYFWIGARGFCMGAADMVPGVSGGTMAFILGIYDELLHAIHAENLDFIRRLLSLRWREAFGRFPWRFLLALGLMLLGFGLVWGIEYLAARRITPTKSGAPERPRLYGEEKRYETEA